MLDMRDERASRYHMAAMQAPATHLDNRQLSLTGV